MAEETLPSLLQTFHNGVQKSVKDFHHKEMLPLTQRVLAYFDQIDVGLCETDDYDDFAIVKKVESPEEEQKLISLLKDLLVVTGEIQAHTARLAQSELPVISEEVTVQSYMTGPIDILNALIPTYKSIKQMFNFDWRVIEKIDSREINDIFVKTAIGFQSCFPNLRLLEWVNAPETIPFDQDEDPYRLILKREKANVINNDIAKSRLMWATDDCVWRWRVIFTVDTNEKYGNVDEIKEALRIMKENDCKVPVILYAPDCEEIHSIFEEELSGMYFVIATTSFKAVERFAKFESVLWIGEWDSQHEVRDVVSEIQADGSVVCRYDANFDYDEDYKDSLEWAQTVVGGDFKNFVKGASDVKILLDIHPKYFKDEEMWSKVNKLLKLLSKTKNDVLLWSPDIDPLRELKPFMSKTKLRMTLDIKTATEWLHGNISGRCRLTIHSASVKDILSGKIGQTTPQITLTKFGKNTNNFNESKVIKKKQKAVFKKLEWEVFGWDNEPFQLEVWDFTRFGKNVFIGAACFQPGDFKSDAGEPVKKEIQLTDPFGKINKNKKFQQREKRKIATKGSSTLGLMTISASHISD